MTKRPRNRRCPTGKFRYADEMAAALSLQSTQRARRPARREHRAEACHRCSGWHLTSER